MHGCEHAQISYAAELHAPTFTRAQADPEHLHARACSPIPHTHSPLRVHARWHSMTHARIYASARTHDYTHARTHTRTHAYALSDTPRAHFRALTVQSTNIPQGCPNAPVPADRGPAAEELVHSMMSVDAKKRPSAAAVIAHAWVVQPGIKATASVMKCAPIHSHSHKLASGPTFSRRV
eukprot:6175259-Pleurochrysis_carterae.AAC.1